MMLRPGSDCGILGKVTHLTEQDGRVYAWTNREVEIDLTDMEMENN